MAPVIRCALVICGLAYYSPHRGAAEIPDAMVEIGRPAVEALGGSLSRPELELVRQMPGFAAGVSGTLQTFSQGLEGSIPRSAIQGPIDPPLRRSELPQGTTGSGFPGR